MSLFFIITILLLYHLSNSQPNITNQNYNDNPDDLNNKDNDRSLKFLFSFIKGGFRQPERGVYNGVDILGESWKFPGELLPSGYRSQFLLGRATKIKYSKFLPEYYNYNDWVIKSNGYSKNLISTNAYMFGLYEKSSNKTKIKESIMRNNKTYPPVEIDEEVVLSLGNSRLPNDMEIFPIEIFDKEDKSYFFLYGFQECKPILNQFTTNEKSFIIKNNTEKIKSMYGDKLQGLFFQNNNSFLENYNFQYELFDNTYSGYIEGKNLTNLINFKIDKNDFVNASIEFLLNDIYVKYNGDEEFILSKITVSTFLNEIILYMNSSVYDLENKKKGVVYSVHDFNIVSFLTYFDAVFKTNSTIKSNYKDLIYNSQLNIELYYNEKSNEYSVDICINQDYILTNINYDVFISKMKSFYMTNDEIFEYCFGKKNNTNENDDEMVDKSFYIMTVAFGVLAVLFFMLFVVILSCCCILYIRKTKKKKEIKKEMNIIITTQPSEINYKRNEKEEEDFNEKNLRINTEENRLKAHSDYEYGRNVSHKIK